MNFLNLYYIFRHRWLYSFTLTYVVRIGDLRKEVIAGGVQSPVLSRCHFIEVNLGGKGETQDDQSSIMDAGGC